MDNKSNGWEWLRLITPILLALSLWIVNDIRANLIKLEIKFDRYVESSVQQDLKTESRLSRLENIRVR
jgi:hypothetical protein